MDNNDFDPPHSAHQQLLDDNGSAADSHADRRDLAHHRFPTDIDGLDDEVDVHTDQEEFQQSLASLPLQYPFVVRRTAEPSLTSGGGVVVRSGKHAHQQQQRHQRPATLALAAAAATFLAPQTQQRHPQLHRGHNRPDSVLTYHQSGTSRAAAGAVGVNYGSSGDTSSTGLAAAEDCGHAYSSSVSASSSTSTSTSSFSPGEPPPPTAAAQAITPQHSYQQYLPFSALYPTTSFTPATGIPGAAASTPLSLYGGGAGNVNVMGLTPSSPALSAPPTFSDTFSLWTNSYGCGVITPAAYWNFATMSSANDLISPTLSVAAGGEPSASLLLQNNDPFSLNSAVYQHSSSPIHLTATGAGVAIANPFIAPSFATIARKRTSPNKGSMPRRKPPVVVKQESGGNISGTSASSSSSSGANARSGARRSGRRPKNDEYDTNMSLLERQKREQRRNRNKEAAARCRARRLEQMQVLQGQVDELREDAGEKQAHIDELEKERASLRQLLAHHRCCLGPGASTGLFVKPELIAAPSHHQQPQQNSHGPHAESLMLPPPSIHIGAGKHGHSPPPTSSATPSPKSAFSTSASSAGSSGSGASISTPDVETPSSVTAMMMHSDDPILGPSPKRVKPEPFFAPFHPPERPTSLPLGGEGTGGGGCGGGGGAGPISTPSNGLIDTPCLARIFEGGAGMVEYAGLLQGRTGLTPQVSGARSVITPSVMTSGADAGELRQL